MSRLAFQVFFEKRYMWKPRTSPKYDHAWKDIFDCFSNEFAFSDDDGYKMFNIKNAGQLDMMMSALSEDNILYYGAILDFLYQ